MAAAYYTLIASLPHLPYFERARELPINPERLERRLRLLEPEDAAIAADAQAYLRWQSQPIERPDAEIAARYDRFMAETADPLLRELIDARISVRTVMAALRLRAADRSPCPGERWGAGPFVRAIERHWHDPDFRLAGVFPWLPEARALHEAGEALPLQRLLMAVVWHQLSRLAFGQDFTFGAVLIYLFKWDILRRWLSYAEVPAAHRFETLVSEALSPHADLFA